MIKKYEKNLMKNRCIHVVLSAILICTSTAQAQEETYNRFSIDAVGGISKVYRHHGLVTGISYPHIELGVRYMTNTKFGIRLQGGFNQFTNKPDASTANEFDVTYTRIGAEGVVNMGRVLNFESWTNRINVLLHAGPGGAWMNSKNSGATDRVLNLNMGITGMIRLSDRIALIADMSNILNIRQQKTFDMRSNIPTNGFDGGFMNFSAGMTVYLGKNQKHADWHIPTNPLKRQIDSLITELRNTNGKVSNLEEKLVALEENIGAIEADLLDNDNDGVANKFDIEPNTTPNARVDTKGQEIRDLVPNTGQSLDSERGLFITIQLGVYSKEVPLEVFNQIAPIETKTMPDMTIRYFSGVFHSQAEAAIKLEEVKKAGISDAFMTAYYKGERITLAEAKTILQEKGPSILSPKK